MLRWIWTIFCLVLSISVIVFIQSNVVTTFWQTNICPGISTSPQSLPSFASMRADAEEKGLCGQETTLFGYVIEGEYHGFEHGPNDRFVHNDDIVLPRLYLLIVLSGIGLIFLPILTVGIMKRRLFEKQNHEL
jgi:hypothetical protein